MSSATLAQSDDKYLHGSMSFIGTMAFAGIYRELGVAQPWAALLAGTTMFSVGLGKEYLVDKSVDTGDIGANAIGTGLGLGLAFTF